MRLVALVRAPARPDDAVAAMAGLLAIPLAEARMRLAQAPPAVIARLDPEKAKALVHALRSVGAASVSVDEHVPSDGDRTVAWSFAFSEAGATFTPRFGDSTEIAWSEVAAVLRAQRMARTEVERTETSRKFSVGTAVATGGLKLSRTTTTSVRSSEESSEQVIIVHAKTARAVLLSERHLDFSCLGPGMQPSSTGNMAELARRLRERAKGAFHDDRLLRLGRRPLPFTASGPVRSGTQAVTTTRTDTSDSVDVLAHVLWQAVAEGLLP